MDVPSIHVPCAHGTIWQRYKIFICRAVLKMSCDIAPAQVRSVA